MTSDSPAAPPPLLPLVVVAHNDSYIAESIREAIETVGSWRAVVAAPTAAGLATALNDPDPQHCPLVAVVDCDALDGWPADCRVPLVAVGDDGRSADLRAALAAGAQGLLAWPDAAADLPGELARIAAEPLDPDDATLRPGCVVVAVLGVHGGDETSVAAHLAGAWARFGPSPVLLADLAGGIAYRLDLAPGVRFWPDLPPASELDGEGLSQMLAEPWPGLSVLPLAALIDSYASPDLVPDPAQIQAVVATARSAYRIVVVDLPPTGGPAVAAVLELANVLLAVGRCTSAGVRGIQAALEAWDGAGRAADAGGAVLTGVYGRAMMAPREARRILGGRLWGAIPGAADAVQAIAMAAEDGTLLLDREDLPVTQALLAVARRIAPFDVQGQDTEQNAESDS